jgi:hypothetical protein
MVGKGWGMLYTLYSVEQAPTGSTLSSQKHKWQSTKFNQQYLVAKRSRKGQAGGGGVKV